ncbi:preprotein translocase subunit YajC [Planctomonas psychrotolerans]|uniref:preprotein translocase subunit YajC n=1 Tax=Planctomonas psychrotolerans TaxID=2528712 RepID=UPI0012384E9F|nr:preprotein translocase subunit YajC [Planctomonas psychrotolerans]
MDPFTLIMLAVLAMLIFFMFRNGRKRQRDLAALQEQMVPGAEVMTSFGLYGTLLSIDEEANTVLVETSPGVTLKLHRQALTRVVDPVLAEDEDTSDTVDDTLADDTVVIDETTRPQFGERTASGTAASGTARPIDDRAAGLDDDTDPSGRDRRSGD